MTTALNINKYLPVVLLYFFFNSFLLPHGLLYTTILTPLLLLWLYKGPIFRKIWLYFIIILPFSLIHLYNGVNISYYIRSFILLFTVYVFGVALYQFLTRCKTLRTLYKNILLLNAVFVLVALVAYFIPSLKDTFWFTTEITSGINKVRLKLFTYEPSYYSTLLVPIALYYYLKITILKLPNPVTTFLLLTIPLLLSLSFGVILGLLLTLVFTLLYGGKTIFPNRNIISLTLLVGVIIMVCVIILMQLFPNNIFVIRIANAFSGRDSSFQGRTSDSFYLSWRIASMKSLFWGVGPGQTKEIGFDIINNFYSSNYTTQSITIPNTLGDTLSSFGLVGLGLRLFFEIYFFFKTKVFTNYYRLSLFIFIFIYQFTGSFITNIAEYTIWILAFHQGIFSEFDKKTIREPQDHINQ